MTRKKKWIIGIAILTILTIVGARGIHWAWKYYGLPEFPDRKENKSLEDRAEKALAFAKRHNMNEHYALFVDYGIPSGTPRLFIWDFEQKKIIATSYVMHGTGGGSTDKQPRFSNTPGSNCSALGRFLVTKEHGTQLQRSYRLKGLDIDNTTAYARGLMIHPAKWVNAWCYKEFIPLNSVACRGCVTVSSLGMNTIQSLVEKESKPLLLWNYYTRRSTQ